MATDSTIRDHKAWLGYVQQEGLVVSPAALVDAQVVLDRNTLPMQERFRPFVKDVPNADGDAVPAITDFAEFARGFLGWPHEHLYGVDPARPVPDSLSVALPDYGETLAPTIAFHDPRPKEPSQPWLLLVQTLPLATDFDARVTADERGWSASPTQRVERLLRETKVPIGIVTNGTQIRLLYAPHGENSGNITFHVRYMTEIAGRPILAALDMLLRESCSGATPSEARLPALLKRSRDYQSTVSEKLAEQVLRSLYELLRGFQAADERAKGELLRAVLAKNPDEIYGGLLTVLMRMVFLLFAEDRGVVPTDAKTKQATELYVGHYSIHGLFERLRVDAERYPDTMDQRYGAWAQLLSLFRAVHGGCKHPQMEMPARHGHLFDPDRFKFLEGRTLTEPRLPLVSDGTIYRVLHNLFILDGERLSYRTLDVQDIGSVYQTIMGFALEIATGTTIALKGKRKNGSVPASPAVNLEELLAVKPVERAKWLKENADTELNAEAEKVLKAAASVDDLLAALEKRIDRFATPGPVPNGGLVLQPTDERRRSGSHYTPRSFTEPIVRKTLEPILTRLAASSPSSLNGERAGVRGENVTDHASRITNDQSLVTSAATNQLPTPEQILGLKICDIAVGSAAFLVEACRQLGDALVKTWRHHGGRPPLPDDETEELLAMRMIAQRCLYGVDRNPMAVDLAKLSLWLATLAKDHPFTFVDHAIRCGDSLVGLTRKQIEDFTWRDTKGDRLLFSNEVRKRTAAALRERQALLAIGDDFTSPLLKREKLELADERLDLVRFIGDAAIAAFFSADKDKAREAKRLELAARISDYLNRGDLKQRPTEEVKALRSGQFPVIPFHWEIEFPEVFERDSAGFDAVIGNPPFAGRATLYASNREGYIDWLCELNDESHGNADLVAHFFRRAFNLLRKEGCLGLIATNTVSQGDTRFTGLRWICIHGGTIYSARKRYKWPGQAAVVVSIVWAKKGNHREPFDLDGRKVPLITAYLFHTGGHENPAVLRANAGKSFQGSVVVGMGFTFDDTDTKGIANPLSTMRELTAGKSRNAERIFPYLGGEEVNESPTQTHHRFIFNLTDLSQEDAQRDFPALLALADAKVKPEREAAYKEKPSKDKEKRMRLWWQFSRHSTELYSAVAGMDRVLAVSRVSDTCAFTFLPSGSVYSVDLIIFPLTDMAFGVLQSRVHESWVRFLGSSMKDDLRYTPTDCFETFPFPAGFETNASVKSTGKEYYEFRAALMQHVWLGLTEIYNLFHSPDDEALARLETLYRKRAANNDWRTAEKLPADRSPMTLYPTPDAALAGVQRQRELHAAMDAAVLTAYGWEDLIPKCKCEFLLDYEDDEDDEQEGKARKRKKPWRYRWPDDVRDEVLARLLKLNAERAEQEKLAGLVSHSSVKRTGRKASQPVTNQQDSLPL